MRKTIFSAIGKCIVCAMAMGAAVFFYGCDTNEEGPALETAGFSLGRNLVEIPEDGGSASVPYFIENPQEGCDVTVDNAQELEWIEFDLTNQEEIGITVGALSLEEDIREAVVTVSYGEEEQSFTVRQARENMNPEFTLEITRTSTETVWAKIVPADPEMHFWINIMETDKIRNFSTDEELFAEDVRWFEKIAELYYSGSMEKFYWDQFENISYLSPHASFSSSYNLAADISDAGLEVQPATDYTVYCYGMDGEGNRLTRIYRAEGTTKDIVSDNTVTYDLEVSVQDQTVYSTITPSDDAQLYFTESWLYGEDGQPFTEEELREQAQMSVDSRIFMTFGNPANQELDLTVEQVVAALFPKGKMMGEKPFTYSDMSGVTFAFSIDEEGQIVSKAYKKEFHLDKPGQSGTGITLEVSNVDAWSAYYTAVPTDVDETYLVYNLKAEFIEGWTDEQIMEHLAAKANWYQFAHNGNAEGELRALDRSTDYVLVAFGYKNSTPVTDLFKYEYRTLDAPVSDVECGVDIKYFDGDEVLELYPEFGNALAMNVFVYAEARPSGNPVEYRYTVISNDSYFGFLGDGDPVYMNELTDDQALYLLKSAVSAPTNNFILLYNAPYTVYAVAKDADGNYGPVYRQEVTFTEDGCLPIDELPALAPSRTVNYVERQVVE